MDPTIPPPALTDPTLTVEDTKGVLTHHTCRRSATSGGDRDTGTE